MKTSKLILSLSFLCAIVLVNVLSFPVQAQELLSDNAAKQPTITKKVKSTLTPRKTATPKLQSTATPRPQNTITQGPTNQNTLQPPTSVLPITQTLGAGTSAATTGVPATVSTVVNPMFSATPTPWAMETISAQQTGTVNASFMTSTAVAKFYSPTPTNFGASSSTPSEPELTATSAALTTTPTKDIAQLSAASPTSTFIVISVPALPEQESRSGGRVYLFIGAGVLFLVLLYFLYREWKKSSQGTEEK